MPSITFPSGSILAPTVLDLSSNVSSIYSTVCANSASWGSSGALNTLSSNWQNTYATVSANSASWSSGGALGALSSNWQNTYTTVNTKSANWDSSYTTIGSYSASWSNGGALTTLSSNWENTYAIVSAGSAAWNSTYNSVSTLSSRWESAYSTLNNVSASFGDSLTWVKNNSSNMYVDRLGINTDITTYPSNLKLAVQGDTVIYGNLSSLGSTTLVNLTSNTTDALSVISPGFNSALYIEQQGGSLPAVNLKNSGSGPMMLLNGNGNVGIGTLTPNVKLTVAGPISSSGVIYASGGNSDLWNTAANSSNTFAAYSGKWESNFNTTNATSASWSNSYNTLNTNSGRWNNSYNTLNTNSGNWSNGYNTLNSNSGNWNNTYNTLNTNSGNWNNSYNTLNTNSGNWNNTYNVVNANSGSWNNSYTSVATKSATWDASSVVTQSYSGLWNSASINYIIDGAGNNVTTGSKGVIFMPSKFVVTSWRVLVDTVVTSLKVDIRRFPNNSYKLGSLSGDSLLLNIAGDAVNELTVTDSASATGNGSIFRGVSANDTLEFFVSQIEGASKRFTVAIAGIKSV